MPKVMTKSINIEDAGWVGKLVEAIEEFRKINPDTTLNQFLTFLTIGLEPGIPQRDLCERFGLRDGSMSRICAVLSERGNRGQEGLQLIEIRPVPGDYRLTGQFLSAKGRRVFDGVRKVMKGR